MRNLFYMLFRILNVVSLSKVDKIGAKLILRGKIRIKKLPAKSKGTILIGNHVTINSGYWANPIGGSEYTSICVCGGNISIGNGVGISNTSFYSMISIDIGDGVCIGAGCKIWDTDFHSIFPEERLNGNKNILSAPVVIKKNAFIGAQCIILKGVTIGENAVIGAGAVVTKDIPPNELWAGNPIRFIKRIDKDNGVAI